MAGLIKYAGCTSTLGRTPPAHWPRPQAKRTTSKRAKRTKRLPPKRPHPLQTLRMVSV